MATATKRRGRDQWVYFHTDWAGYDALLSARGERSYPRITYLDGRATLVSPGYSHESIIKRIGWLFEEVLFGLRIRFVPSRATTLRREAGRGGVEGDETYYIANAAKLAGKKDIDLRVDPPPDLAIEAVVSHPVKDALEVYRRFGVPEVWVCDGRRLRILILQPDTTYAESATSGVVPCLTADEVLGWVQRPETGDELEWRRDVRHWVENELVPRHRAGGPG
jgi:Uma2 family endonuclease